MIRYIQQYVNRKILFATIAWSFIISFTLSMFGLSQMNNPILFFILYTLSLILYPILAIIRIFQKTRLWRNILLFSIIGVIFSSMGIVFFSMAREYFLPLCVKFIVYIWGFNFFILPFAERIRFFKQERVSPYWQLLSDMPFTDYLLLKFDILSKPEI